MTTRITRRARATRAIGLLGGLAVLAGGGSLAAAGPRGPVVAIDKAHEAADRGSVRAQAIDREAGAAMGVAIAPNPAAGGARGGDRAEAAKRGNATGVPRNDDGERQQLASVQPETAKATRYDPARHRDPFRPPSVGASAASAFSRTPLERYDLGQLKLVGVVWEDRVASAMVEDSAGKGYIVTTGTPIGSSGGVVRSVEPRRILIEESITNFYGNKEPREVVMKLPEEDRSP